MYQLVLLHVQFLPSVTELVVAQCYYLDFDDRNRQRPIYVYLNSTGCMNEQVCVCVCMRVCVCVCGAHMGCMCSGLHTW